MKKLACISGIIVAAFISQPVLSQDIHFSQITEAPLFLNPANTGVFEGYLRATLNYRNQWTAMVNPYKTMAACVDGVIGEKAAKKAYMGWGVGFFNDQAGVSAYSANQALLSASGIVHLDAKNKICVGIGGGYAIRSANYGALTFGNQYNGQQFDPTTPSFEVLAFNQFSYADVNAGLQWEFTKTEKAFDRDDNFDLKVGVAGFHLNQPLLKYYKYSKEKLPMRLVGEIASRIDIKGTKLTIMPSMIYMKQASFSELNLGTFVRLRFKNPTKTTGFKHEAGISLGMYIRPGDAIIPQMLIDYASFSFGFSYDYNISSFKTATRGNGGIEFSLQWHSLRDALFKRKRELGGGHGGPKATP
ncbi:MAG: PorP/SprF family type IX secretion system membrane protein [Bacteroidia bacterium]|nr:PorP/SprF family type IX secretion system membrane protein [Bacteroidia bacterium]